jgi:hypothetical protein
MIQASQNDSQAQGTGPLRSQRDRCQDQFEARHRSLIAGCTPQERLLITKASSYLGRRWMSIIPLNNSLKLSDFEVSSALHLRTLLPHRRLIATTVDFPTSLHNMRRASTGPSGRRLLCNTWTGQVCHCRRSQGMLIAWTSHHRALCPWNRA